MPATFGGGGGRGGDARRLVGEDVVAGWAEGSGSASDAQPEPSSNAAATAQVRRLCTTRMVATAPPRVGAPEKRGMIVR